MEYHSQQHTQMEKLLYPFQEFFRQETSGGILLILATVIALVWANSPWQESYRDLWEFTFTIGFQEFGLTESLLHWINDGLMAVFFFVVGLEIKREVLAGELSSMRQAALPIAAAIGGMAIPAFIYILINMGGPGVSGWGIPMATDIAFALGVLALLGDRVPASLKVFLAALAIVDDIGAVLVIAFFYTADIAWFSLLIGLGVFLFLALLNRAGVKNLVVYMILGMVLWVAFLKSGIHATVAGVLLAMTIPSKLPPVSRDLLTTSIDKLSTLQSRGAANIPLQQASLQELEVLIHHAESPLQRLEHTLHPWVAFFIIPVFALANAGVSLGGDVLTTITQPVSLGVIGGLIIGKQIGVTLFSYIAVKTRFAELPNQVTWLHIYGVSWLAGIGFTMSLFIAGLAFGDTPLLSTAKMGILSASLVTGVTGWILLRKT